MLKVEEYALCIFGTIFFFLMRPRKVNDQVL